MFEPLKEKSRAQKNIEHRTREYTRSPSDRDAVAETKIFKRSRLRRAQGSPEPCQAGNLAGLIIQVHCGTKTYLALARSSASSRYALNTASNPTGTGSPWGPKSRDSK